MNHPTLDAWHALVESRDPSGLDALLADDVVFHSPVVHTPQQGKAIAKIYLGAALQVLGNESFRYVRQVHSKTDAVLEFSAEVQGIAINGVDMMRWNARGEIVDFKVMLRPLKAINLVHQMMGKMLNTMAG